MNKTFLSSFPFVFQGWLHGQGSKVHRQSDRADRQTEEFFCARRSKKISASASLILPCSPHGTHHSMQTRHREQSGSHPGEIESSLGSIGPFYAIDFIMQR